MNMGVNPKEKKQMKQVFKLDPSTIIAGALNKHYVGPNHDSFPIHEMMAERIIKALRDNNYVVVKGSTSLKLPGL